MRRAGCGSKVIAVQENIVFSHSIQNLKQLFVYPESTYRENIDMEHVVANEDLASKLGCNEGTAWFRIRCIRKTTSNTAPICWTDIYLLPRFSGVVRLPDHATTPVYEQIERLYGERVERASICISTTRITKEQGKALKAEIGGPAVNVIRRYFNADEIAFEVTMSSHPEGRHIFSLDFRREVKRR